VDTSEAIEIDHLEAIKRTVEIGYGVTVAPDFAVSREVELAQIIHEGARAYRTRPFTAASGG
jgi:DNA-binding transcriptional LysR family regulator